MRKISGYIVGVLGVGYLSYQYPFFSFVLLLSMAVILVYILFMGLISLFRKRRNGKWVQVPMTLLIMACIGLAVGLIRPLQAPVSESGDVSSDLEYAYTMDQGDRKNLKFFLGAFGQEMKQRDSLRLDQVRGLQEKQAIDDPKDKFYAAFILHHNPNGDSALYRQAHTLAKEAASAPAWSDDLQAQWLVKATYDRWMLSIGKDQKYNTQGGVTFEIQ